MCVKSKSLLLRKISNFGLFILLSVICKKNVSILSLVIFSNFFSLSCTPAQINFHFTLIAEGAVTNLSLIDIVNN